MFLLLTPFGHTKTLPPTHSLTQYYFQYKTSVSVLLFSQIHSLCIQQQQDLIFYFVRFVSFFEFALSVSLSQSNSSNTYTDMESSILAFFVLSVLRRVIALVVIVIHIYLSMSLLLFSPSHIIW